LVHALLRDSERKVRQHGKCGLLSPPGDIDALAANLVRLLDDRALRTQFGEYGRSRVEQHFTPQRLASDFAALYARILA